MTKTFKSLVALAVVLVLAVLSNPSPERHREKIREAINDRSPIANALGVGSFAAFASTYRSLGVASYTTTDDKMLSFGVFGMVFVSQSLP